MQLTSIKTRPLLPPRDDLLAVLDELDLALAEKSVMAISSKVAAIHQGRCVPVPADETEAVRQKEALIKQEAEQYLLPDEASVWPRIFTIYEGTLCSSSGIDASNSNGYWTLLPKDSDAFAAMVRAHLCDRYALQELGVIVLDSRSYPLRNGTIGISLGYAGFRALYDYRGQPDIFGKPFASERINVADCIASAATLAMGEGNESTPLCVVRDIPHISFTASDVPVDEWLQLKVSRKDDVFAPFYRDRDWQQGGNAAL